MSHYPPGPLASYPLGFSSRGPWSVSEKGFAGGKSKPLIVGILGSISHRLSVYININHLCQQIPDSTAASFTIMSPSSIAQPSLLIFTTSQSPLPVRFPRPHKPTLNLPALVHRSLHSALDVSPPSISTLDGTIIIPHPDTLIKHDVPPDHAHPPHTSTDAALSAQPEAAGTRSAKGDELEAEITVKIHLVGEGSPSTRAQWVDDALETLRRHKGLSEIDTLLVGFKGVDYKGKRTIAADFFGCGAEGLTSDVPAVVSEQAAKGARETWEAISQTYEDGKRGVKDLGTLYLPLDVLQDLGESSLAPKVNSLDTPDCHSLPKEYTQYAKDKGIELWAGGGGEGSGGSGSWLGNDDSSPADPIPDADLHNLLQEFAALLDYEQRPSTANGTIKGTGPQSILAQQIPLREDGLKYDEQTKRGVNVRWVLSVSRGTNLSAR